MAFSQMLSLSEVKNEPFIIENIRWDLEPRQMMDGGAAAGGLLKGYIFYIDTIGEKPVLALMRHTAAGYAETLAQIDEIPDELLLSSIDENKDRKYFSMFPINSRVEDWLKTELGIK